MKYDTAFINRNFRLKVYGTLDEKRINTLVGVSVLIALIGIGLANKVIDRALKSKGDYTRCKLRRGILITLYNK